MNSTAFPGLLQPTTRPAKGFSKSQAQRTSEPWNELRRAKMASRKRAPVGDKAHCTRLIGTLSPPVLWTFPWGLRGREILEAPGGRADNGRRCRQCDQTARRGLNGMGGSLRGYSSRPLRMIRRMLCSDSFRRSNCSRKASRLSAGMVDRLPPLSRNIWA